MYHCIGIINSPTLEAKGAETMNNDESNILIYQTEEGNTKIDVRLENETVWMTQKAIAELYQSTKQNISLHIKNI